MDRLIRDIYDYMKLFQIYTLIRVCSNAIIYMISRVMKKKYEEFVFKKKDLEIESNDGIRYIVNPEKDVCLYKTPYRSDGEAKK